MSEQQKHTPGRWTVAREEGNRLMIRAPATADTSHYGPRGAGIAKVLLHTSRGAHDPEIVANANLIAAAPDLLAALKVLLDEACSFSVSGVGFAEQCMGHKGPALAGAAIDRAEGR